LIGNDNTIIGETKIGQEEYDGIASNDDPFIINKTCGLTQVEIEFDDACDIVNNLTITVNGDEYIPVNNKIIINELQTDIIVIFNWICEDYSSSSSSSSSSIILEYFYNVQMVGHITSQIITSDPNYEGYGSNRTFTFNYPDGEEYPPTGVNSIRFFDSDGNNITSTVKNCSSSIVVTLIRNDNNEEYTLTYSYLAPLNLFNNPTAGKPATKAIKVMTINICE
jgi:hypothetical protein